MRALLLLSLLLAGCASERVILLPDAQGKVGKILVSRGSDQALLDSAYGTAEIGSLSLEAKPGEAEKLREQYRAQLDGLPPRPLSYILYFLDDSDDLTADSAKQAPAILAEISARPAAELVVIGHTDRMGSQTYNDLLSLQRAKAIRDQLIALGFDESRLRYAGRGEREPLVTTADEVSEARNRRVEINVR
ncbi:OmpA family protein [Solimonas sp. K1W22B-7]|uniref:OmpA family protein n=1 Tax=Solimonas sp. K1W22B-7 TaxID=2303331 RepID=UPI000E335BC4|nr:OmpA family protein [Solimonas sp. K1W22B-7]AXQ30975.1 OmpA family protein [Solimonas sp. K1W22B-7]